MRLLSVLSAAGTALTASSSEAVLTSATLKAYSLQPNKVYRLQAAVIATATNSTDTLTVKVRVGPTTLTGTVCASTGAVDVANSDVAVIDISMVVRDADAASVVMVTGSASVLGAEGTATLRSVYESLSLDNAVDQLIEITGQWSTTSASNSCRADQFILTELV